MFKDWTVDAVSSYIKIKGKDKMAENVAALLRKCFNECLTHGTVECYNQDMELTVFEFFPDYRIGIQRNGVAYVLDGQSVYFCANSIYKWGHFTLTDSFEYKPPTKKGIMHLFNIQNLEEISEFHMYSDKLVIELFDYQITFYKALHKYQNYYITAVSHLIPKEKWVFIPNVTTLHVVDPKELDKVSALNIQDALIPILKEFNHLQAPDLAEVHAEKEYVNTLTTYGEVPAKRVEYEGYSPDEVHVTLVESDDIFARPECRITDAELEDLMKTVSEGEVDPDELARYQQSKT